jgi:hypothetical protein
MLSSHAIRARLRSTLRRDLVGPGQDDSDLAAELLSERPGRWYLTGFLVPTPDAAADPSVTDPAAEMGDPSEMGDPLPGAVGQRMMATPNLPQRGAFFSPPALV